MRVLIVDDCQQLRNLIRYVVTSLGHTVVGEAADGLEAINLYHSLAPDVITMDMSMPRMNGLDAIRSLELSGCQAKIIIITGESDIGTIPQFRSVVKCLYKPFSLAEITATFDGITKKCS